MPRDEAILREILEAAARVEGYLAGVDEARFFEDELLQSAVAGALLAMSEASVRLSIEARALAPDIRWRDLAATRRWLVAGDSSMDWRLVWRTALRLPPLLGRSAEGLLARLASHRGQE